MIITDCGILRVRREARTGDGAGGQGKGGRVLVLEKTRGVGAGQAMRLKSGNEVTGQGAERGRLGDRPTDPETRRLRREGDPVIPRKAARGRQRMWKH